jgi:predicted ATPase
MSSDVPTLVLMVGLPGAGKSTLALALGRALGWPVVDKDIFDAVARTAGGTPVDASPYDVGSCRHSMIWIRLFLNNGAHC